MMLNDTEKIAVMQNRIVFCLGKMNACEDNEVSLRLYRQAEKAGEEAHAIRMRQALDYWRERRHA